MACGGVGRGCMGCGGVTPHVPRPLQEAMAAIGTATALGPLQGPVCKFTGDVGIWFDLMQQYFGLGEFPTVAIMIYFCTSSDSGSLVVDMVSSNGDPDPHLITRLFWSATEGAVATGLIVAGKCVSAPSGGHAWDCLSCDQAGGGGAGSG